MTKAHSDIGDNGGRCEKCDRPESVYELQRTHPVYLAGGLGWGTMWLCPSCYKETSDEPRNAPTPSPFIETQTRVQTLNVASITPYLTENQIAGRVKELGKEITNYYQGYKKIVLVCVLKGSFIFAADLARQINLPLRMEFIGIRSYEKTKSTGAVQITQDLTSSIEGERVLIVEDIIDTGITCKFLMELMSAHRPSSLKLCSLLSKPSKRKADVHIDFLGFEIKDEFVVGYGLDYEQTYRNLPYIGTLNPSKVIWK
jgi:hypoxanthine phosphoribosyltransferase